MEVENQFDIRRLAKAIRSDIAGKWKSDRQGRYFRAQMKGRDFRFYLQISRERLIDGQPGEWKELTMDEYTAISDDFDAALKLNDLDQERNYKLIQEVAKHVAAGHYNSDLIELLRKVCEVERLHDAEAILASAPPREYVGPIEEWCIAATRMFCQMEHERCCARKRIIAVGSETRKAVSDGV